MRIPAEAVPYVESPVGKSGEADKAEPVYNATATGSESSYARPEQLYNEVDSDSRREQSSLVGQGEAYSDQERRCGERRNGNKPVLLDTRVRHLFRRKVEASTISLQA